MELGKLIIEKLSQYNFLTNILPGTVLCIVLKYLVEYDLVLSDTYLAGILFYFVGMINSRVSSIIVEPFLKWIKWLVFAPYPDFVKAEQKDGKLTLLSQENNTYRSYVSVMFISLVAYLYKNYLTEFTFIKDNEIVILLIVIGFLFMFAYRKQTGYVRKRVETLVSNQETNITEQENRTR